MRKSLLTVFASTWGFVLAAVVLDPAKHFIGDQIKHAHLLDILWVRMIAHPGELGLGFIIMGLVTVWAWLGERVSSRRAALPEFDSIRLFSRNSPQDIESWKEVRDGVEFRRNYELAADPVFDITVKNTSSNPLMLYRVGIRILQRIQGKGGTLGYSTPVKVQAEHRIRCPQEWKRTWGRIDEKRWEDIAPIQMKKGDYPFRFTLMLENFCDRDNASSCEVRFYLVTGNGTTESKSIWLSQ
jgi:hypothetical protein